MIIVKKLSISLSMVVLFLFAFFQIGFSQTVAELDAAQQGMNTLDSSSTGAPGGNAVQNAKLAAGGGSPAPEQAPPPQQGAPGTNIGMEGGFPGEFPGGVGMQLTPTPTPFIKMVTVLQGKRIKCMIPTCQQVLEDARYEKLPEAVVLAQPDRYFNDGTHGDLDANDEIFSNVEEESNWLCPKCNMLKEYTIALLSYANSLTPLQFFQLIATTGELISTVPRDMVEEELKDGVYYGKGITDEGIAGWVKNFLAQYRTDPNDLKSDFIPIYVPLPPEMPAEPLPPNFEQIVKAKNGQAGAALQGGAGGGSLLGPGGEFLEGPVTGEPQGNASSNYFDTNKMK